MPSEKLIVLGKVDFILNKIYFSYQLNKLDPLAKFNLGKFIGPEVFYVVGGASAIEQIKKMKNQWLTKKNYSILSDYQGYQEHYLCAFSVLVLTETCLPLTILLNCLLFCPYLILYLKFSPFFKSTDCFFEKKMSFKAYLTDFAGFAN
jgi:hypothetical protein